MPACNWRAPDLDDSACVYHFFYVEQFMYNRIILTQVHSSKHAIKYIVQHFCNVVLIFSGELIGGTGGTWYHVTCCLIY